MSHQPAVRDIDVARLDDWLAHGAPIAVLDLRSDAEYGYGDPLVATPLPLARFDTQIAQLLPRRATRTVLVHHDGPGEGGAGDAQAAALRLTALGYTAVHVLRGGLPAWIASGRTGVLHTPARVFTQELGRARRTPSFSARDLVLLRQAGRDVVVLDVRTLSEFERGHVPQAIHVPGGELLLRFADLVPSAATLVLTSCAGLPRAVVAAQTLIDAGVPNRVAVLHEGTKGWIGEGWTLERGPTRSYGPLSDTARSQATSRAARLQSQAPLAQVGAAQLAAWRTDTARTTYLFDLRSPEEFAAHSLEGSVHAPGGQLALNAHRFAAVRGARLVLIDDHGVRAASTAHWLRQRGWDVSWYAIEVRAGRGEPAAAAA